MGKWRIMIGCLLPPPPLQWTPNPLARHSTTGGNASRSPGGGEGSESPQQGLAGVLRLLEREGRVNQVGADAVMMQRSLMSSLEHHSCGVCGLQAGRRALLGVLLMPSLLAHCHCHLQLEALKASVAQYETSAAELQATNHELAEALQQVRRRLARVLLGRQCSMTGRRAAHGYLQTSASSSAAEHAVTLPCVLPLRCRRCSSTPVT